MTSKMRAPAIGRKPSVALHNEEVAAANIKLKLAFLRSVLSKLGSNKLAGSRVDLQSALDGLPRSTRQFNAWTSETARLNGLAPTVEFRRNAQVTLKNVGLVDEVTAAMAAVKNFQSVPGVTTKRDETIAGLRRLLKVTRSLLEIVERELLRQKAEIRERDDRITSLSRQVSGNDKEAKLMRERLEARIRELEATPRARATVIHLEDRRQRDEKER